LSDRGKNVKIKKEFFKKQVVLRRNGEGVIEASRRIIVVGGGAAGMMAAISARRMGAGVTLLERNPRIGKKILATGNGRCNFTNVYTEVSRYHGADCKFAEGLLMRFDVAKTLKFFNKLGIAHKIEEDGKVFPMSDQASSVLDVLRYELSNLDVEIVCDAYVKNIQKRKGQFVVDLDNGLSFWGSRVILTTGGKAMPSTGSDGNGFELARKMGHKIVDIFPALVQLKLQAGFLKQIEGVKFIGTVEVIGNKNNLLAKERGNILFTNYGISGPPVLQVSRKAGELLRDNQEVWLKVRIIDTMSKGDLDNLLAARFRNGPEKSTEFSLVGLINKRLISVLLKEAGINERKCPVGGLDSADRKKIAGILTEWKFKVTGTKSWPSAQVTAGGVDTGEINGATLESKIVQGLFFAGEIIDIDGDCGGFNLQWAWSSGFVAGQNAVL